ncbi:biotin--[acetyl-CoA-carboxylase] ligase [Nitratiruptor sp. YY09-18]|uniref:biotin--[acetyl-CoA-carboxylase] ligase n=1 Tax=Nitratiruptor sp. YY09-18 TaxID=2724901 RepID=UPI00191649BC|nr:biotin--[acetyl-CoA-carboxylase] ligase [Nitratiruptor sp. YY09-18]BCD67774.1 BirA family transcriptional regulator, biotin operon repressor / biotin---[acetyl-CoA-carboxylase] ligase [Nitratiruptor sp. YY09-18]
MEIIYFDAIDSTQKQLIKDIKCGKAKPPIAYFTNNQTGGVGSRNNQWIGLQGNFFLSFAIQDLPKDLPNTSIAIYLSYILKIVLKNHGSNVWIKWPNDFYIESKKIGGCVTNKVENFYICGIGLNTKIAPANFGKLDIEIDDKKVLAEYFGLLEKKISWKEIFSKYQLEFYKSKKFFTHVGEKKISLSHARLAEDGALVINNERIYSLR